MKGRVKFFNESKGFGFIAGDDGNEYFVHQSGLKEGVRLQENDQVTFDVVDGERGPKAENVALDTGEDAGEEAPAEEPAAEESSEEESTEEEPAEETPAEEEDTKKSE